MSNTSQSKIINKLKGAAKGAWKNARKTEARPRGGGGLPPNLKNVVGACQTYKLGETNNVAKDPYFQLGVIIKDPEELEGRKTSFMWFINESEWTTVEDNLTQLSNDLQLLDLEMPDDVADVLDLLKELCERGAHILFNTGGPRQNGKPPKTFIQGLADPNEWPDEPQDGAGEAESKPKPGKGGNKNHKAKDEPEPDDNDDQDEGDDNATAEDEGEWVPQVKEKYYYTPPKGKKSLFTVIAVDEEKKTVDLKGGKPPKTFAGVKWWKDKKETESNLEGEE